MNLLMASDFPQWGFSVYFVGYVDPSIIPADTADRWTFASKIPGTVELTWNHGTEKEDAPRTYNTGNSDTVGTGDGQKVKGGFGHLGISVPDVYEACERFKELGVRPIPPIDAALCTWHPSWTVLNRLTTCALADSSDAAGRLPQDAKRRWDEGTRLHQRP